LSSKRAFVFTSGFILLIFLNQEAGGASNVSNSAKALRKIPGKIIAIVQFRGKDADKTIKILQENEKWFCQTGSLHRLEATSNPLAETDRPALEAEARKKWFDCQAPFVFAEKPSTPSHSIKGCSNTPEGTKFLESIRRLCGITQ
jgi:hypothetical protein